MWNKKDDKILTRVISKIDSLESEQIQHIDAFVMNGRKEAGIDALRPLIDDGTWDGGELKHQHLKQAINNWIVDTSEEVKLSVKGLTMNDADSIDLILLQRGIYSTRSALFRLTSLTMTDCHTAAVWWDKNGRPKDIYKFRTKKHWLVRGLWFTTKVVLFTTGITVAASGASYLFLNAMDLI